MKKTKGNLLIGQSGGPTAVINSTLLGVIEASKKASFIGDIIGSLNGVLGIINENFIDLKKESNKELKKLKYTPAAALGSVRYKVLENDLDKILEVFKKYNIKYFIYIGGNDSMDTANKISKFFQKNNYDCKVIGLPKTIDNDLDITDHTPGYGSAAKFIITSVIETYLDANIYNNKSVTLIEIMGRNSGFLAASSFLASKVNMGPDLVYLPEVTFDYNDFLSDIKEKLKTKDNLIVCLSEGIKDKNNDYISNTKQADIFGNSLLGGVGLILKNKLEQDLEVKVRQIELSTLQRSAAHIASKTDIKEAYNTGKKSISFLKKDIKDIMIGFKRVSNDPYKINYIKIPLDKVANSTKKIPLAWIKDSSTISNDFYSYLQPLVKGEIKVKFKNGIITYTKLEKFKKESDAK